MMKRKQADPEEVMEAIRLTHGYQHPPCPRCPENPDDRPFSGPTKRKRDTSDEQVF